MDLGEPDDAVLGLEHIRGPWVHAGEPHRGEPRLATPHDVVHRVVAHESAFGRFEREHVERGLKDAAIGLPESRAFRHHDAIEPPSNAERVDRKGRRGRAPCQSSRLPWRSL